MRDDLKVVQRAYKMVLKKAAVTAVQLGEVMFAKLVCSKVPLTAYKYI